MWDRIVGNFFKRLKAWRKKYLKLKKKKVKKELDEENIKNNKIKSKKKKEEEEIINYNYSKGINSVLDIKKNIIENSKNNDSLTAKKNELRANNNQIVNKIEKIIEKENEKDIRNKKYGIDKSIKNEKSDNKFTSEVKNNEKKENQKNTIINNNKTMDSFKLKGIKESKKTKKEKENLLNEVENKINYSKINKTTKLEKEVVKLIEKIKDNLNEIDYKLFLIKKEKEEEITKEKIISCLSKINKIENDLENILEKYFDLKDYNYEKIEDLNKAYNNLEEIKNEKYNYINFELYCDIMLNLYKADKLNRDFNELLNVENEKTNIQKEKIDEPEIIENKIIDKQKIKKISDEKKKTEEEVKEIKNKVKEQNKKIKKLFKYNFNNKLSLVKANLKILASIPIFLLGYNVFTFSLSSYFVYKGIKESKDILNNKKTDKKDKEKEMLSINFNNINTGKSFIDKSIYEIEDILSSLEEYEKNQDLLNFIQELSDIKSKLYKQKYDLVIEENKTFTFSKILKKEK